MKEVRKVSKKFRINPILDKELIVNSRSIKFSIFVAVYNLVLMLIALSTFSMVTSVQVGRIDYQQVMGIFPTIALIQCLIISIAIPILTASSIAGERERQTLDVLLTTPVKPVQIVWGKIFSSMVTVLMYLLCSMPIMSLAFIFGGMSWISIIKFIFLVLIASLLAGSIGVFTSSVTKKTIASIIISLIILGVFIFGTAMLFGVILGLINLFFNSSSTFNYKMFFAPALVLGNPAVLVGNSVVQEFSGYGIPDLAKEFKSNLMPHMYFVTRHWTIFSIIVHLLFTRMFVGLASRAINPLKGKTPKQARVVNNNNNNNNNSNNINNNPTPMPEG
jgi:ABC-type transport system involved in multi-copper enzyme maturation permease subunit